MKSLRVFTLMVSALLLGTFATQNEAKAQTSVSNTSVVYSGLNKLASLSFAFNRRPKKSCTRIIVDSGLSCSGENVATKRFTIKRKRTAARFAKEHAVAIADIEGVDLCPQVNNADVEPVLSVQVNLRCGKNTISGTDAAYATCTTAGEEQSEADFLNEFATKARRGLR